MQADSFNFFKSLKIYILLHKVMLNVDEHTSLTQCIPKKVTVSKHNVANRLNVFLLFGFLFQKSNNLTDLDLIVGVYRFLYFNFGNYSTRWNFSLLTKFLLNENDTGSEPNSELVKWFTLKVFSLLLSLTPAQTSGTLTQSSVTNFSMCKCYYCFRSFSSLFDLCDPL